MIKTFKTKQQVEVNARTRATAKVFVDISDVIFNGLAFYGKARYYYKDDANNQIAIEATEATFTVDEANQLAGMAALDGATFTDQFVSLIVRATMYQFDTAQYYGLTSADWEVYVEPEPEEE